MSPTRFSTLAALLVVLLSFQQTNLLAGATADEKEKPVSWMGLVHKDTIDKLPGRINKKRNDSSFATGVLVESKAFEAFARAASEKTFGGKKETVWQDWQKDIDWKTEAVVYVVLTKATNRLTLESWKTADNGTGTLNVRWILIEPFYGQFYPAVFSRVPKKDLKTINVKIDNMELADIPLKSKEKQ